MVKFFYAWALVCGLLASTGVAIASVDGNDSDSETFEAIRQADVKMATIGWRLSSANVRLCDRLEPGTGLQIHTLDQFDSSTRDAAKAYFKFASSVAVEGVVPGTPADRAGLRADDSLVRIGGIDVAGIEGEANTTTRLVAVQLAIAALPPTGSIEVNVLRDGVARHFTVQPTPVCKSRFELRLASDYGASADGTMVQVSSVFFDTYPEDQVVAVIAHEFSHNILHHRDRLSDRGVAFGMLSGFGGNVKYFRQTELQADLLSVYLLTNAGYRPRAVIDFWRSFGPSKAGGFLRSRSHPYWRDRVATLEKEIEKIEPMSARPLIPGLIAERDQPLSGDWKSILVRH